jgi:hypothetical protein
MGTWAMHRRRYPHTINEENVRRQLIDQMKYWITICQLWGFTPAMMADTYWRKSATVRARFAEEFVVQLNQPTVILDLDNVLCDYTEGFFAWAVEAAKVAVLRDATTGAEITYPEVVVRLQRMRDRRIFYSAENAGIDQLDWMHLQHAFRVGGGFGHLPPMPGLADFVSWIKASGYCTIGLTSRAIDAYPNIIDDTLSWLKWHDLDMDCVWWGTHKGEKLVQSFPDTSLIEFVVDDDPRYLEQYVSLGVKRIYWMKGGMAGTAMTHPSIIPVGSLADITWLEVERGIHGLRG